MIDDIKMMNVLSHGRVCNDFRFRLWGGDPKSPPLGKFETIFLTWNRTTSTSYVGQDEFCMEAGEILSPNVCELRVRESKWLKHS